MKFDHVLTSSQELRERVGEPGGIARDKQIDHIDGHCATFIAASPMLMLATTDANGRTDVSPRGDAPGFARVLDRTHLAIPERTGNNRIDSLMNIIERPNVGMLFIIPGIPETLRMNGTAQIVRDPQLLESFVVQGKVPKFVIVVRVEEAFIHCGKAFKRSGLWEPITWTNAETLPSRAEMFLAHANVTDLTTEQFDANLEEAYRERLY
jgi:uncharacterized protein